MTKPVTRFAPSPTGYLHIGGARTALFSYLFARQTGGKFRLRIEDTDVVRSTQASVDAILEGLTWLGLTWDEEVVFQTDRFDRYRAVAEQWVTEGKAYRCYCTKERLETLRATQLAQKEKPRYDGHCRHLTQPQTQTDYVIRFKTPQTGCIAWEDLVHGNITFQNSELDDLILLRSDGTPMYNFTVVIDDYDMGMTHVLRGDDHINNTPRQLHLFQALGVTSPQYGHLPMILGSDGQRLSKRHGAVSVMQYRDEGYLPQALLNYLVRLGWSHGDQEIFSLQEMIQLFQVNQIHKSPAAFNLEKLLWLNQQYLKTLSAAEIAPHFSWHLKQLGLDPTTGPALETVIAAQAERVKTLKEMAEKSRYFYTEDWSYDEEAVKKHFSASLIQPFAVLISELKKVEKWEPSAIHQGLEATLKATGLKLSHLGPAIRIALTGNTISPPLDVTLYLVGQNRSLERLQKTLKIFHQKKE